MPFIQVLALLARGQSGEAPVSMVRAIFEALAGGKGGLASGAQFFRGEMASKKFVRQSYAPKQILESRITALEDRKTGLPTAIDLRVSES
jgi:hypothetical protein